MVSAGIQNVLPIPRCTLYAYADGHQTSGADKRPIQFQSAQPGCFEHQIRTCGPGPRLAILLDPLHARG